jgi:acetyl esterase
MESARRLRGVRAHLAVGGADEPAPLAPDTRAFMDVLAALPVPEAEPPLAVRRAAFDAMIGQQAEWGIDASSVTCAEVSAPADGANPPVPCRVYSAPGGGTKPVLLYFHGGGWVQGTAAAYGPFTAALCARGGFHVVSVEYRLAPKHPAPAASDDCLTVLKWLANGGDSPAGRSSHSDAA